MKKKLFQSKIQIQKSTTHGYGVFARKNFRKGEKIEECYIIVSRGGDRGLEDFYFDIKGKYGIFTGFGIIYNHSEDPNADYFINVKRRLATIKAARKNRKTSLKLKRKNRILPVIARRAFMRRSNL